MRYAWQVKITKDGPGAKALLQLLEDKDCILSLSKVVNPLFDNIMDTNVSVRAEDKRK